MTIPMSNSTAAPRSDISQMPRCTKAKSKPAVKRRSSEAAWNKDRQTQLIRLAAGLFLEYGYVGVSMEMIVAQTGGSYRDVYREFWGRGDSIQTSCFRCLW